VQGLLDAGARKEEWAFGSGNLQRIFVRWEIKEEHQSRQRIKEKEKEMDGNNSR
jgi:hypothetical protein